MVWALSPLGIGPNPSQTRQTVRKLVTPSLPNVALYPFSLQPLAHSLFSLGHKSIRQLLCHHIVPHSFIETPGVGIPPQNSLLFSRAYPLLPRSPAPIRSGPLVYLERVSRRATSTRLYLPVSSLESALPQTPRICGKQITYKNANSFRICTYIKHREGGLLAPELVCHRQALSARDRFHAHAGSPRRPSGRCDPGKRTAVLDSLPPSDCVSFSNLKPTLHHPNKAVRAQVRWAVILL